MPGFMQSIKSHLPQSPFNPTKKNGNAINPIAVVSPEAEGTPAEEQPSAEILTGDATVPHDPSTVALTLTPANGEPSHQIALCDAEVVAPEESNAQLDTTPQQDSISAQVDHSTEPTEAPSESKQIDAARKTPEEVTPAHTTQSEQLEPAQCDSTIVQPSTSPEEAVSPQPENVVVVQPKPQDGETKPTEEDAEGSSTLREEPATNATSTGSPDVTPASLEASAAKTRTKSGKENFSCHIQRNKSKKTKSPASPESTEDVEPVPSKPRKSHPLSGKFRNVIDQVRSKVKKDKEALATPPVVTVIEPRSNCDDTSVAA